MTTPEGMSRERRPGFLVGVGFGVLLVIFGVGVWFAVSHQGSGAAAGVSPTATTTSAAPARPSGAAQPSHGTSSSATGSPTIADLTSAVTAPAAAGASLPDVTPVSCPKATVSVSTADELTKALSDARPGAVIVLADGSYVGNFVASVPGTKAAPIYLCGGRGAVLDGGNVKSGYVLHLQGASYWRVVGFAVRNAQKGVVLDASSHSVVQELSVSDVGDEGIHLRSASSFNVIALNTVTRTGLRNGKFGEGIYIGSARKNWSKYGAGGGPDRSDYNVVRANRISATTAECVDIKEGTTGGLLEGNIFDGTGGLTSADSWVDVKGNDWHIVGNTGTHSPADGFQTHQILNGWGTGNVFEDNHSAVGGPGYGIHVTNHEGNTVRCDNTASGAGSGNSNVTCTG